MLIKKLLTIAMVTLSVTSFAQNVGVNADGSTADPSAMLDVKSTDKGVLVPRMTQANRNGIPMPATGLLIFQTDNAPGFYYNSGTPMVPVWTMVSSSGDVQGTLNGLLIGQGTGNPSVFLPPAGANNQVLTTPVGGGAPTWSTPSNVTGSAVVNVSNGANQVVGANPMSIDVAGTSGGVMYGTGASSDFTGVGNNGDVLVSGGSGAPMWASPNTTLTTSSITGSSVVNVTNGGGQTVGSGNAVIDVVGTQGGVMYGTGASSAFTGPSTSANQVLATPTMGGTPQWVNANSTLTTGNVQPATSSTIVVNNGTSRVLGTTPLTVDVQGTSGGVMYGTGAAPAAFTGAGTTGQYLRSNGSSAPAWTAPRAYFSVPCANNGNNQPSGTTTIVGYSGLTWNSTGVPGVNMGAQVIVSGSFYQAQRDVFFVRASGWVAQTVLQAGTYLVSIYRYPNLSSGSCGNTIQNIIPTGSLVGSCTLNFGSTEIAQKYDIDLSGNPLAISTGDILVFYITNNSGINKTWVCSGTADFYSIVQ
ncbi:MAG: hypothetical protein JNL72_06240 [Flavipsychrobacter sp.]|nr:hypothetical protein [Flavipsychrobacter sp.]